VYCGLTQAIMVIWFESSAGWIAETDAPRQIGHLLAQVACREPLQRGARDPGG